MKGRILVVDDDRLTRVALAHQLALEGHEVRDVDNPIPALALLAEEPWDLVLTDLRMPTMDGLAFLRRIRETRLATAVIVVTGHATVQTAVEAMKRGAEDYLVKPVDFDELNIRVEKIMARLALERELRLLRRCPDTPDRYHALVGRSPAMRRVFERIDALAGQASTVLLLGETGTGKDLVARTLHHVGARGGGPFVKTSCAVLSREVLESELFGHEAGAFTGALRQRRGRFELAHHGTLFLDEVDDIPLDLQVKLLQVLEERRFERCSKLGKDQFFLGAGFVVRLSHDGARFVFSLENHLRSPGFGLQKSVEAVQRIHGAPLSPYNALYRKVRSHLSCSGTSRVESHDRGFCPSAFYIKSSRSNSLMMAKASWALAAPARLIATSWLSMRAAILRSA